MILNYNFRIFENFDNADQKACALAAYNCGLWLARKGYEDFGDPDHYTTPGPYLLNGAGEGDYSKDVIQRQKLIRAWVRNRGWAEED